MQLMQQVRSDPNVPQLQVMRKQVSRILQRFTSKRYALTSPQDQPILVGYIVLQVVCSQRFCKPLHDL